MTATEASSTSDVPQTPAAPSTGQVLFRTGYRLFAYFGVMTVTAALVWGFRHDVGAPWWNYPVDVLLYTAFLAPHLMLTRREVKESVWGRWSGTLRERQWYITLTIVSWLLVLWLHRPLGGPQLEISEPLRFAGLVGFLWAMLLFYQDMTREALDGLLGVPGSELYYSHNDSPLLTEGQYAQVRHPMYRALVLMGLAALVMHPNIAQLFWSLMLGVSFIGFIPIEERELLETRGDEYRRYCQRTPYRLFRGIW